MAGSGPQKQLLTLIRDFTTEKSQEERKIVNQKKQIRDLTSELEAAYADLEEAKRFKETTEQELKGYEVELSMNEASNQALEARIAVTNNERSKFGNELAALKNEENSLRDCFIEKMLELNAQIRNFQQLVASSCNVDSRCEATLYGGSLTSHEQNAQKATEDEKNKLAQIILQINQEEQQYNAEQVTHDQIQEELTNLEKKASLLETVIKESMELQELSRQTSELEEKCAALGDELQKKFMCPRCHQDNSEELGDILQMSEGT